MLKIAVFNVSQHSLDENVEKEALILSEVPRTSVCLVCVMGAHTNTRIHVIAGTRAYIA